MLKGRELPPDLHQALAPDGLVVTLGAGSVLAYPEGTTVVTVPWNELRPFLKPTAPLPPQGERP